MKKRLFLISNPTHLLNAQKFIEKHPEGNNDFILTFYKNKALKKITLNKIASYSNLNLIKYICLDFGENKLSILFNMFNIIFQVLIMKNKIQEYDEILFSSYYSWLHNYIIKFSKAQKIVYITDGTEIIKIINERKKTKYFQTPHSNIYYMFLRLKPINNLHFFSSFILPTSPDDTIELFNYNRSKSYKISEKIIIIGSPLVELGYLEKKVFLDYLKEVKNKFDNYKILYYLHRYENKSSFKNVELFYDIVTNKVPIEELFESKEELPEIIISFFSTALINLSLIYQNINFYYIKPKKANWNVSKEKLTEIENLYNEFKNMNLNNLKELKL